MDRQWIIPIAVLLLILAGCGNTQVVVEPGQQQTQAPQQTVQKTERVIQPQQNAQQAPQQAQAAGQQSSVITPVEYDKKVKALLDKAGKVKSYAFYYVDKDTQLQSDHYYIKGSKAVIRLYDFNEWNKDMWVDSIYLDMNTKTATGFCERREPLKCGDHAKQYRIDYSYFIKKFPLDWLNEIPPSAKVVSSETVDDRFTDIVGYTDPQGHEVRLSMDQSFGVPLRVTIDGKQAYYYRDTAFNAVKDTDLVHQMQ